jgi:hypothetical protein
MASQSQLQSSVPRISINTCSNHCAGRKSSLPTTSAETEALCGSCPNLCSTEGHGHSQFAIQGSSSCVTSNPIASGKSGSTGVKRQRVACAVAEGVRQLSVYCSPRATRRSMHESGKHNTSSIIANVGVRFAVEPRQPVDKEDDDQGSSAEAALFTRHGVTNNNEATHEVGSNVSDSQSEHSASRLSTCAPSDFTGAISWEGGLSSTDCLEDTVNNRQRRNKRQIPSNYFQPTFRCANGLRENCSGSAIGLKGASARLRRTNSNPENLFISCRKGELLKDSRSCTNLQRYVILPSPATGVSSNVHVSMATGAATRCSLQEEEGPFSDNDELLPQSLTLSSKPREQINSPYSYEVKLMTSSSRSSENLCDNTDRVRQWLQGIEPATNTSNELLNRDFGLVRT